MSNTAADIRARIARGEIKVTTGSNGPKVGEGTFECLVTEASYGKGEAGTNRGMVKLKVLSGGTDAEIGGQFNLYVQTTNQKFAEQSVAQWQEILMGLGVSEDKIYDDANDLGEIIGNIMVLVNKQVSRGGVKLTIKRKEQAGTDAKGNKRYYNDIVKQVKQVDAPATAEEEPELPFEAPATTPVATAPSTKKKPWEK